MDLNLVDTSGKAEREIVVFGIRFVWTVPPPPLTLTNPSPLLVLVSVKVIPAYTSVLIYTLHVLLGDGGFK